ncbi:endospore germination permease [Paenibacillus sp. N3.4]|uniref:endospore germination permease n=1 Tax=Paenibacillus sp. N3.4 TaxID=2603222 RepID=UPI0011C76ECE|nr:endospore germination permease [Paenibacillus sp. N3.4]TXK71942.1 GerAB/ArcD/ProY family transporter [Paenibacillus sp. N3.4]
MSIPNTKVSFLQVCMVLMMTVGFTNHVVVNPLILEASGRDAWISAFLAGVLFLPWCALLVLFMKKSGQQKLQPWLAVKTSPLVSWMIVIPLILLLFMIGGFTIVNTVRWTVTNYMPNTPKFILILALCVVCCFYAMSGIRMIAISAGIMLPFVVILGFFVAIANASEKDYSLLQPILENGWQPTVHGMIYAGGGFVELIMILAVQHRIKSNVQTWKLILLASFLIFITMGPIIGGITEFGYKEAAKQMESSYEQWRLLKFGNIEHVDFFSEYQWLSGAIIRTSFSLFLLGEIIPFQSLKKQKRFILLITLSYILIAILPFEGYTSLMWMYHYYFPISLTVMLFLSAVCITISFFSGTRKERLT